MLINIYILQLLNYNKIKIINGFVVTVQARENKIFKIYIYTCRFTMQTLGGERWFVKSLELEINTADKHFGHIKTKGKNSINKLKKTQVGRYIPCR